ncbi:hypothetical protein DH2020_040178 [Rehmannia glutinosa]|uniref:Uncharacterized protein n=1 Tax=Rehmannia glutinosa TaxID=99300 RepID=A0ABR0UTP2_REHGL
MATEIGLKSFICFHLNRAGGDDCSNLVPIHNDVDAMNLVNFVDENRMVCVYVEHEKICPSPTESHNSDVPMEDFPTVDEPLKFVGENEDSIDLNEPVHEGGSGQNDVLDDKDSLALKNLLWKAARATRVIDFANTMDELKKRDASAYEWLSQRPAANWSRSHFRTTSKCDMLLNNMSESFNSMIMRGRCRPILTMLEILRVILMRRIHVRRDQMDKYHGDICPKITKLLEEIKKKSMEFITITKIIATPNFLN